MDITYTNTVSVEDCAKLRDSAGWALPHPGQIEISLKNSALIVAAKDGDATVGMARLVSDGGYVIFVVDVLVLPEYQRMGIGKAMMEKIMEYVDSMLEDGYYILVDLMAAPGKEEFYEEFGFIKRPNDKFGYGMSLRLKKEGTAK